MTRCTLFLFVIAALALPSAYAQRGALNLTGKTGFASTPHHAELNLTAKTITVEAWIKHDGKSDEDAVIVTKRDFDTANYELSLVGSGEEVPVRFFVDHISEEVTSTIGVPAHQWTHVAGTYNGIELKIYINGELAAPALGFTQDPNDNTQALSIGARASDATKRFSGLIDEVRVWKKSRSADDIKNGMYQALQGNETDLVAYYPFTGASTGTPAPNLTDQTATKQNLALNGDPSIVTPGIFPVPPNPVATATNGTVTLNWSERLGNSNANKANGFNVYRSSKADLSDRTKLTTAALGGTITSHTDHSGLTNGTTYYYQVTSLDNAGAESDFSYAVATTPYAVAGGGALKATGGFASVSNRPNLNISGKAITVEAWVKHDGTSDADAVIVTKRNFDNANYELSLVGQGEELPVRFFVDHISEEATSTVGVPANKWTHVAGVYDGSKLYVYINGKEAGSTDFSQDPIQNTADLTFGGRSQAPARYLHGQIDEVRIWNIDRSAADILADMDNTLNGNEDNLVAYYRFDGIGLTDVRSSEVTPSTVVLGAKTSVAGGGALPVAPTVSAVPTEKGALLYWSVPQGSTYSGYRLYRATKADLTDRAVLVDNLVGTLSDYEDKTTNVGKLYFYQLVGKGSNGQESDVSSFIPVTAEINLFGNALVVGGGGYVSVEHRPGINLPQKAITVEAWIRHTGKSLADAAIVTKRNFDNANYELSLVGSGDEIPVRFFVGHISEDVESTVKVKKDVWTHVAGMYNGAILQIFVNGEPAGIRNFNQDPEVNTEPLTIGGSTAQTTNTAYFQGTIDEVRIWSRAVPATEIKANYNKVLVGNENGLAAYFRLDNDPGATVTWGSDLNLKSGEVQGDATFVARATPVAAEDDVELPTELTLANNFPNPFRTQTTIRFGLPQASDVRLVVYDASGRQIAVLVDGQKAAGYHDVKFDAGALPSGMYFYRLVTDGKVVNGRMVIVR